MVDYARATRLKATYNTPTGLLTIYDLWELPLTTTSANRTSLDNIAKALHREIKNTEDSISFVETTTSKTDEVLHLKFEIVKDIIAIRKAEAQKAAKAAENRKTRDRIAEILAHRQDKALENKGDDELKALFNQLKTEDE